MSSLLILGAGGHSKVLAEAALASGTATNLVFLDDRSPSFDSRLQVLGWPVMGPLALSLEDSIASKFESAVVAIGNASTRLHWVKQLHAVGYQLPTLIHPAACISPSAQIGPASAVLAQVVVQAHSSVGTAVILNSGCSVDHDTQLSDGVHVCPGARLAGEVQVGARSWIGIGASVIQQVCIGSDVTIGAGAAVTRDIPDGVTAVGVPARVLSPI